VVLHQRSAAHVPPRSQHALECNVQKFANLAFYSGHTTSKARWAGSLALLKRRDAARAPTNASAFVVFYKDHGARERER
jgi:hypothetical protein